MPEPIKLNLSSGAEAKLVQDLDLNINGLKFGLQAFHETKLPEWRRIYEARPLEETRSFPFENASNLVVPLAGIHCDTLKARVISAIWRTRPLWMCDVVGDFEGQSEPIRDAWQRYLLNNAVEPTELDLYRVESEWIGEIIRYGSSVMCSPYEQVWEDYMLPAGDGTGAHTTMREMVYKGPKPEKLALEDCFFPPDAKTLASAGFIARRIRYKKEELRYRRYTNFFDPASVDKIIKSPDRTNPGFVQSQLENDSMIKSPTQGFAEWDVFECWFPYREPNGKRAPRVIVWYHLKSQTILRAMYDSYTPILGCQPFVFGRLLYRDNSLYGYGLCETLSNLQEEVSMIHNQRRDNMTVANTRVWRADPDSKLHQGYSVYPSAMLPALKGEIEPLQHGEVSSMTIDEERLAMDLAERRSGVSPPMQGMGAGTNTKKGVYTAMGTMSLMQEGNGRTDMTIADIRNAHVKLGRMISQLYAHFGLDERKLAQYGKMAANIKLAAEMIRDRKMALPINPSTASINREVEKQNDLMLTQIMARHYSMITQLMMQLGNSALPNEVKAYSQKVIEASDKLMKQILRNFDHDDVDAMVPKALPEQPQGGQNAQKGPVAVPSPTNIRMPVPPRSEADNGVLSELVAGRGEGLA